MGIEVAGNVADVVTAVGEEGDLLISGHAVGLEYFEQPAFGFGVVGLHVAETAGWSLGRDHLAGDHFKPAVAPGALGAGVHVAAVEPDGQREVRAR